MSREVVDRTALLIRELKGVPERYWAEKLKPMVATHCAFGSLQRESATWERETRDARARITELQHEVEEQARLLGMSGSREAALRARVEVLEKALRELVIQTLPAAHVPSLRCVPALLEAVESASRALAAGATSETMETK